MIKEVVLLSLTLAVTIRAKRSWKRPAWWATVFALLSMATYGFLTLSPTDLDGLLGSQNRITLVRDATAVTALWLFHNAVAKERKLNERLIPLWVIIAAIISFALPFVFVRDPGPTSQNFVLDRLDQTTVWLFSSMYTMVMALLAIRTIWILASKNTLATQLWVTGLSLMFISDLLELGYLAVAHFCDVTNAFRAQFYGISKWPFFIGVTIAVVPFIWIGGVLSFWWFAAEWTWRIAIRSQESAQTKERRREMEQRGWTNRQKTVSNATEIRNRLKLGTLPLLPAEVPLFAAIERCLSSRLERRRA